jgi:hypothetical protein
MARKSRVESAVLVGACGSLALAGCASMGEDAHVGATITWWKPDTNGTMQITAASQPGSSTQVRLDDDLGLGGDNQFLGALDLEMGRHRIGLEYEPLHFDSTETLGRPITFHGATYPTGDRVRTDLDLVTWGASWSYRLSEPKQDSANALWLGVGAWWWDFEAELVGLTSGNAEHRDFSHVYPGVTGEWTFDLWRGVLLDLSGTYCLNALDSRIWDVAGGFAYAFRSGARIDVGYRHQRWDFNESTNDADFALMGPYASFTMRF